MALDPYSPCPCGSGKKFKWCCQDVHADITRAYDQEEQGQHEAALRIMEGVARSHPNNPEAWGRLAQLLYAHDRTEDAETTLQKAFDLNPNYPFGLFLRAQFRFREGEMAGALLLARKAAEAFDPEAHGYLGRIYSMIFEAEMHRNRPVAARAALRIVTRCAPADEELRQQFEAIFGPESRLPACSRQEYTFRSPVGNVELTPKLGAVAAAFEKQTQDDPHNAAAWYNLGLVQAWLGENRKALESLNRYLEL